MAPSEETSRRGGGTGKMQKARERGLGGVEFTKKGKKKNNDNFFITCGCGTQCSSTTGTGTTL